MEGVIMKAVTLTPEDFEAFNALYDKRIKLVAKYQQWKVNNTDKSLACKSESEREFKAMKKEIDDKLNEINQRGI